jgi:preprotein translocase SecF subunit
MSESKKNFDKTKVIDFMKQRYIAFVISAILIVGSIFLILEKGLNFGVDFTGGIVIEIKSANSIDIADLRSYLYDKVEEYNINEVTIQNLGSDKEVLIRVANPDVSQEERVKLIEKLKLDIAEKVTNPDFRKVDYVGPQVGEELIKSGINALLIAFLGMMLYIWIRFEWQFGLGAIIALIHDVILTLGLYSLLNLEFNITSIAAILTIIGYSINDSVVIYDRIRENLRKFKKLELKEVLNLSINNTLSRTILTAGTTLLALLALIVAGGEAIYGLSLAVFVGVVIGTYSSIYIASPVLQIIGYKKNHEDNEEK